MDLRKTSQAADGRKYPSCASHALLPEWRRAHPCRKAKIHERL